MTTMESPPTTDTVEAPATTDTVDPTAHLSPADIENLGAELDAIREEILASRGESDAAYIRTVIDAQRKLELSSRAILLFSLFPPAWLAGTVGLSVSKIIEKEEPTDDLNRFAHLRDELACIKAAKHEP